MASVQNIFIRPKSVRLLGWINTLVLKNYIFDIVRSGENFSFDQRTWSPEFGDNDKDYKLPENRELYINMKGSNYVVRKETGQAATCKLELQTAVTPGNATDGCGFIVFRG